MAKPMSTPAPVAKSPSGPSQGDAAAAAALAASAPVAAQPGAAKAPAAPAPKSVDATPATSAKTANKADGREKNGHDKDGRDGDARDGADVAMADASAPAYAELAEAQAAAAAQTSTETPASEDDGEEGGASTALIIGGVLLGGAGIALAAGGGGGDSAAPTPAPPPTPPANAAPTVAAATQAVTTNEDAAVNVTVAATDSNGDTLTYTAAAATNGTVTGGTGGAFTYTPRANFAGTDSFVVTVSDGRGGTVTQTVNVTVAPVNDAPTIAATQTVATNEDTPVTVTAVATDIDSTTLTYATSAVTGGTVAAGTTPGSFVFTPSANFNGPGSFTITASDGAGGTATQTVTVNVAAINDAPVLAATQTVATNEDTAVTVNAVATDVDSATLTYATSAATGGVVTAGTTPGSFIFTPTANFNGTGSFVVTASDGSGGTASQTVTVNIAAVNDAPTIDATSTRTLTTPEDTQVAFVIDASDIDTPDAQLTARIATAPANGTIVTDAQGNSFYRPNANFSGNDSFVVEVGDGQATTRYTVGVTVTPVNDAPTFAAATRAVATDEDVAVTFAPAATDVDGDPLTYTVGQVANGTATVGTDGRVTFTPAANFSGQTSFVLSASDGRGGTASQTVTVTVGAANDAPVFAAATLAVAATEDQPVSFTVAATDIDGDALTYTAAGASNGVVTSSANGSFTYTPNANFAGTDTVTVTASDGRGGTATQTVRITVANVNDAPVFAAATQAVTTDEDTAVTVTAAATDVDGDALTYTAGSATNGTVTAGATPGSFVFTPAQDFAGPASFVITARDATGAMATQTVNVTVVNRPNIVNLDTLDQVGNGGDGDPTTVRIFDAGTTDFRFDDSSGQPSNTQLNRFGPDDVLQVDDAAENYNFSSNGTDIFVSYQTPTGVVNLFTLGGVVANPGVLVFDEATAERAAGFDFFRSTAAQQGAVTVSLDVDTDNNLNTVANFSGAGAATTFTQNANTPDFVRVSNFGADDRIVISNAATSDFNFSSNGTDIFISYQTPGGASNDITLAGAVRDSSVLVSDEASAERAVGFDFFQAVAVTPPQPPVAQTSSLDTDTDNNPNTQATFDASTIAATFTENANLPNFARVTGMSSDDRILVSNAAAGEFNFSSNGRDIFISYQTPGGTVNDITLVDAVRDSTVLVFDEATAERAVGFDFFQFG